MKKNVFFACYCFIHTRNLILDNVSEKCCIGNILLSYFITNVALYMYALKNDFKKYNYCNILFVLLQGKQCGICFYRKMISSD